MHSALVRAMHCGCKAQIANINHLPCRDAKSLIHLVHMSLCGLIPEMSVRRCLYVAAILDGNARSCAG